jgi:hypothetical protein
MNQPSIQRSHLLEIHTLHLVSEPLVAISFCLPHLMDHSPAIELRDDGEMADASPPPRAPLGSSGSVPAFPHSPGGQPPEIRILKQALRRL